MVSSVRKPFQGLINIIRFNWHYYVLSVFTVVLILIIACNFHSVGVAGNILATLIIASTVISLAVSTYIYDFSDVYKFSWLDDLVYKEEEKIINIHAGFDETSQLIKNRYSNAELFVADFYDASRHTEISIQRARGAYPSFPGTKQITTANLPFDDNYADKIFNIFSAHEIRNKDERIVFFRELYRVLKPGGKIFVTEHLRDPANFLAYNVGFFHFHSRKAWLKSFRSAGLSVSKEIKITPFITTYILEKNGTAS
jgi:ubiquinone/menaquinone biosynthesis C-methylase UbiE